MTFAPITVAQMREVDRLMVEEYGIALPQMMENAGRNLAELARWQAGSSVADTRLVIVGSRCRPSFFRDTPPVPLSW